MHTVRWCVQRCTFSFVPPAVTTCQFRADEGDDAVINVMTLQEATRICVKIGSTTIVDVKGIFAKHPMGTARSFCYLHTDVRPFYRLHFNL